MSHLCCHHHPCINYCKAALKVQQQWLPHNQELANTVGLFQLAKLKRQDYQKNLKLETGFIYFAGFTAEEAYEISTVAFEKHIWITINLCKKHPLPSLCFSFNFPQYFVVEHALARIKIQTSKIQDLFLFSVLTDYIDLNSYSVWRWIFPFIKTPIRQKCAELITL